MGAQRLLIGRFLPELDAVPQWFPAPIISAYVLGAVLFGLGACITLGYRLRTAATTLAGVLFAVVVLFHVPRLIANISNGGAWTGAMEIFALGAAALIAAERWIVPARLMFGVTLPGFGILHFIYHQYVASVIPAWIPGPVFWAYFTGLAHMAAGIALLTGMHARLAAILLGSMFGSWVILLHVPRALADLHSRAEWTSLFVATALCGGAWLIVGTLSRERPAGSRTLSQ